MKLSVNNNESKTYKSVVNIIFGVGSQVFNLLLSFISRTIFIRLLGAEYLGINGLFTNILTVLSLAELGFGNAIIYSMYKPLVEKDEDKMAALLNFYKKAYNSIAFIVFIVGVLAIPFLKYLVNLPENMKNINVYYFMFLMNTVLSYLFSYKSAILTADQKGYLLQIYSTVIKIVQFILQIAVLILTHNYILYLVIQLLCTLINNVITAIKTNKLYPFIKKKNQLSSKEKKNIFSNVGAMFIYKVTAIVVNNTDNILISVLVGTISVGYYSNYYLIINSLNTILNTIFSSVYASIGQLNAGDDLKRKYTIFKFVDLCGFIIFGVCTICLVFLMNDFIFLWIGNEYLLDNWTELAIIINFYMAGILNPVWMYRDTTGLFRDTKLISILNCILNLILSIILGKIIGMFGILIATAISRLLTTFWYNPYMLFKKFFKKKPSEFFKNQILQVVEILFVCLILSVINKILFKEMTIFIFIVKALITFFVSLGLIVILNYRKEEFKYLYENIIKKFLIKLHLKKV